MATTSIAPAATFLNVSLCKRSSGKNLHRKKGQRKLELTAGLRVSRGHPNEPGTEVDVRPIHLLSVSGDRRGARQQRKRRGRGHSEWEDEK